MAGNPILNFDFANTVCNKGGILLIFEAEHTKSVLDILSHPESTVGPIMAWPEEKFAK